MDGNRVGFVVVMLVCGLAATATPLLLVRAGLYQPGTPETQRRARKMFLITVWAVVLVLTLTFLPFI
jgi:hypothetical protein